ncbi:hypothetical protein [Rhizobium sp. NXC24]|uniref:hypothetical protein n=1 Tax=Rhizobium sp. NXC24 TaxID=2048897 RepID=UPI000CDF43BE|nr:hypothetical protein [Rhizobium sp. NXC24]AVA20699.1 hypothetical protein NXC24_CH01032 [Rhizobium sp. NXC24]
MVDESSNRLPYWPAALNKKMAAAYCGLSYELFTSLCLVAPIAFTGSTRGERYLRQRLDEWLLSLDPNGEIEADSNSGKTRPPKESLATRLERGRQAPDPEDGPGGYPIVDDPSHPLKQWYDKLGFDPRTMGQEDMNRLMALAEEKWKASIPGKPIGKREKLGLEKLSQYGVNGRVSWRQINGCGDDTVSRLEARGFVGRDRVDNIDYFWITEQGLEAHKALLRPE